MNFKNIVNVISSHKDVIIKKTLLIGGSVVGLALTAGLLNKEVDSDVIVIHETDADGTIEDIVE